MDNKFLYQAGSYTIEKVNEEDRVEYFQTMQDEFIHCRKHGLGYVNKRKRLKQEVRSLYTDGIDITYIMRYKGKFICFFQVHEPTEMSPPVGEEIYIIKKFRKSKALACAIDYISNFLYKDDNIIVIRYLSTGLEKLLIDIEKTTVKPIPKETRDRARNICKEL